MGQLWVHGHAGFMGSCATIHRFTGESDIGSYGYRYRKHLPISNRLTFIVPDLRSAFIALDLRSALCKQMGSIVLVDWTKHRLDC